MGTEQLAGFLDLTIDADVLLRRHHQSLRGSSFQRRELSCQAFQLSRSEGTTHPLLEPDDLRSLGFIDMDVQAPTVQFLTDLEAVKIDEFLDNTGQSVSELGR